MRDGDDEKEREARGAPRNEVPEEPLYIEIPGDKLPSLHKLPADRWPASLACLPHITASSNPASLYALAPRSKGTQRSAVPLSGRTRTTIDVAPLQSCMLRCSTPVDVPSILPPRTSSNRILNSGPCDAQHAGFPRVETNTDTPDMGFAQSCSFTAPHLGIL